MQINDTARYAYDYLLKRGVPANAAAAIVGNLAVESGNFDPDVLSGKRTGDNGTAHYAQQLRGQRLKNYNAFAHEQNRSVTSLDTMLDFTLEEMNPASQYSDAIASKNVGQIMNATSVEDATGAFMTHYERPHKDPKINHIGKRTSYAQQLAGNASQSGYPLPLSRPSEDEAEPSTLVSFTQPSDQGSKPELYDDSRPFGMTAGDGLIAAGMILMGESPAGAFYSPQYNSDGTRVSPTSRGAGETAKADNPFAWTPPQNDQGLIPNPPSSTTPNAPSINSAPVPLGRDAAQVASTNNQFGLKPANDKVNMTNLDQGLIAALNATANHFGQDLTINSGFRSQAKQDRIRASGNPNRASVARHSHHTGDGQTGSAADISIRDMSIEDQARLVDLAVANGVTGVGHYNGHLHLDMRNTVPKSFNAQNGWGGWTSIPPEIMAVLIRRGYKPNANAADIIRGLPTS